MSERVRIQVESGVAEVIMARPEARNGLDLAMFEGLVNAAKTLMARKDVRAVVLHGEGPAFCAGLDFRSFLADPNSFRKLAERTDESPANLAQRVAWIWRELPVPIIAAVHGPCFGGGLQIALGADLRIAAPDARLSVMEIEWGIVPDMGATRTLLGLVRADVAKELTFTGRIVSGDEAAELGLVTRISEDPLGASRELASAIARRSPHAIAAAKSLYERAPFLSTRDAFVLETELQIELLGSPNQLEAVQARMGKREAKYADRE